MFDILAYVGLMYVMWKTFIPRVLTEKAVTEILEPQQNKEN